MRLIIVRHGETYENVARITQGWSRGQLNENGIAQAKKVARRLKGWRIDAAYVSDLARTRKTAEEILTYHPHVKPIHTKLLRERCSGVFEGMPHEEKKSHYEESGKPFAEFRPPRGETFLEVKERMIAFLEKMRLKHAGERVLIVGHGASLCTLLLHLKGKELTKRAYDTHKISNTSITVIDIDPLIIKRFNDTKHLESKYLPGRR